MGSQSKYDSLQAHLERHTASELPMTFAEIERTIRGHLPQSAFKYPAWWSNNPSNNVMTKAWLDAGYKTERVDLGSQRVVFRRTRPSGGPTVRPISPKPSPAIAKPAENARQQTGPSAPPPGVAEAPHTQGNSFAGLYGILRGTARLRPDVDLTAPTGEIWNAEID